MRIKQLPCQTDFLQGHSTPIRPKAESVPNFYQVQTFRRRNETRAISVSCSFLPRLAANAAKSCVPTNFFPAVFRRPTSNGDEMCHARPNSRGGRIGAAQVR